MTMPKIEITCDPDQANKPLHEIQYELFSFVEKHYGENSKNPIKEGTKRDCLVEEKCSDDFRNTQIINLCLKTLYVQLYNKNTVINMRK